MVHADWPRTERGGGQWGFCVITVWGTGDPHQLSGVDNREVLLPSCAPLISVHPRRQLHTVQEKNQYFNVAMSISLSSKDCCYV